MQYYSLNLVAAPAREIWFSTVQGFHPGTLTNIGTGADLLSSAGHFVKTKAALLASVGIPLPAETLGIDALHLGSGGEIYFSLTSAADSTTLGKLNHGDLLSDRGRVVQSFQMLLTPFSLLPPIPDLGLDAVSVRNDGEILFSIQSTAFSQRVGAMLQSGDVLSSRGAIYRSNRQLLARLQPTQPDQDYGLDALHVWEHGEIWFSVERTFQSQTFGQINPGDLLSDQGLVVFRNLTLMEVFKPKEYLADFGLDALFVVSDLSRSATPGRLSGWQRQGGDLTLHWSGPGRVFSLERAGQLHGPYQPAGVLTPDSSFTDSGALTNGPQAYYRLQQW
jgi:hypothetical protein